MPWLTKSTPETGEIPLSSHLFFVHVPRCGGTSLMQHFDVPRKVIDARGPLGKMAMKYFFMRYKTLESSNFPVKTKENAFCAGLLAASFGFHRLGVVPECWRVGGIKAEFWIGALAVFISLFMTIICTAPVIGRITPVS